MDDLLRELKPVGTFKTITKGGNVLFQGEIPRSVMMVRSGIVRAYTITSSGEERTVSLHGDGDLLPLSWVLGSTSNSLFYYEAVTDCRIFQIPKLEFNAFMASNPERTIAMLRQTAMLYTSLLLRITGLEQSRAIEKIGFTLYYLLFTRGKEISPGVFKIDVRLSHSLFGSLVGLTRESTAKNMKQLRDKGIIDYASFTYTVHKTKLEAFLGEDGFRDLSV
ncbi:Crp/Fnr family transcriptional regulator [Candidatus Saccharibacteria bacterium]|nr:Crp/Fnr family transcriptional regulator [Candidatus Saccharibacteria bacterium]